MDQKFYKSWCDFMKFCFRQHSPTMQFQNELFDQKKRKLEGKKNKFPGKIYTFEKLAGMWLMTKISSNYSE